MPNINTPTDDPAKNEPMGDYAVGYCKPPVAHRFKHGNNANPKGRKKGTRNRKVITREVLLELVTVRGGSGETRQMSALEAVLKKTLAKALHGDHKAGLAIIAIAQKEGLLTPEQEDVGEDLSASDRAIMEDLKARMGPSAGEQPPGSPQP